jgi:hypothetical protein
VGDRLIIPAPPDNAREAGVEWYEVTVVDDTPRTLALAGFALGKKQQVAGRLRLIHPDDDVEAWKRPDAPVRLELGAMILASGELLLFGRINNKGFSISNDADTPTIVPELEPVEIATLTHWSRLDQSMVSLAHATRNSWGPVGCTMMAGAATLSTAGCLSAIAITVALPKAIVATAEAGTKLCAGALASGATIVEECLPGSGTPSSGGPAATPPHPPTITYDPPTVTIIEQQPVYIELDPPPTMAKAEPH